MGGKGGGCMRRFFCQEDLKLLACVTMLVDHSAILFRWSLWFRAVGRLAFPIYCFLLAEGVAHTRNARRYFLRLGGMALLSESVYDFVLYGGMNPWAHQNVLWTLLLGAVLLWCMGKTEKPLWKLPLLLFFALAAELLHTSYGGAGILLIALFGLTRGAERAGLAQTLGLAVISLGMNSVSIDLFGQSIPVQLFAVAAMVPVCLYSGEKRGRSRWASWGSYLFYPVHLLILEGIRFYL